jgi:hypothetical protein
VIFESLAGYAMREHLVIEPDGNDITLKMTGRDRSPQMTVVLSDQL